MLHLLDRVIDEHPGQALLLLDSPVFKQQVLLLDIRRFFICMKTWGLWCRRGSSCTSASTSGLHGKVSRAREALPRVFSSSLKLRSYEPGPGMTSFPGSSARHGLMFVDKNGLFLLSATVSNKLTVVELSWELDFISFYQACLCCNCQLLASANSSGLSTERLRCSSRNSGS